MESPLLLSGTIIMGIQRPSFVVLGADQLEHGHDAFGRPYEAFNRKIVLHPKLPLALATAGYANFSTQRKTIEHLEEVIGRISESVDLTLEHLRSELVDELHANVLLRLNDASGRPGFDSNLEKLDVFIALVNRHQASFGLLRLTHEVQFTSSTGGQIGAPSLIGPFLSQGRYADEGVLFGDNYQDSDSLACHVHRVLSEAIGVAVLLESPVRTIGGNVDIVIVDAEGARIASG